MPVEPLSVDDDSAHASAVDLFVERASRTGVNIDLDADRNTITSICQQVGGLPLAIELAAARTAVMTPSQILDRLEDRLSVLRGGRDGPDHHRTIEATIGWSYDLLDKDTQRLLRYLSVFESGFDLEQAEDVGGRGTVDRLADLVRKSLVHRNGERFGMLEAVRQYATTRLREQSEEADARRRHFEYFAEWAHEVYHRAQTITLTEDERQWITANLSNLRRAVDTGVHRNDVILAAEVASVLWPHLIGVLYDRWDFHDWYEPLLDHLHRLDFEAQMAVLHGSGTISLQAGDVDRAHRLLMKEYEIHRRTGLFVRTNQGAPQNNLALLALHRGDWDEADRLYQEGIDVTENAGRRSRAIRANYARLVRNVYDEADRALKILQDGNREATTTWDIADELIDEAQLTIEAGHYADARVLVTEALASLRREDNRPDLERSALYLLSFSAYEERDLDEAVSLLLDGLQLEATERLTPFWQSGWAIHVSRILIDLGAVTEARRVLNEQANIIGTVEPVLQRRLSEQLARLPPAPHKQLPVDNPHLVDAVRQALERHKPSNS